MHVWYLMVWCKIVIVLQRKVMKKFLQLPKRPQRQVLILMLARGIDYTFKLIEMKRSLSFKIIAAGVEAMDVNIQPSI